jgi:hypothetical protein
MYIHIEGRRSTVILQYTTHMQFDARCDVNNQKTSGKLLLRKIFTIFSNAIKVKLRRN